MDPIFSLNRASSLHNSKKDCTKRNCFGRKSGRGYYNYAEGSVMPQPKQDEELGKYIFNRVIVMLINEAIDFLVFTTRN